MMEKVHMYREILLVGSVPLASAREVFRTCAHTLGDRVRRLPRSRDDDNYFRPLRDLRLPRACRLFLGLVHAAGGLGEIRRRIVVAERFAPAGFGIATECRFGRRDPASVPHLLRMHVDA
jgi:hypothetical protein